MTLVNFKEMLKEAKKEKYAVGAFDISNYEMVRGVTEVAEELNSPLILSAVMADLEGTGIDYIVSLVETAAKVSDIPVCLHLDHATDVDFVKYAINKGFSSVMFDGSKLDFEDNVEKTKQVCKFAHKHNITVEAELGHVTNAIVGNNEKSIEDKRNQEFEDPNKYLTKPEETKEFIDRTNIDALAVAIGTAHGVYIEEPKLDLDRLDELNEISSVPLVMHGGSGVTSEEIEKSIKLGMCKINIFSEILDGLFTSLKNKLNEIENMSTWPSVVYQEPVESMKKVVREKIILFGSKGKA